MKKYLNIALYITLLLGYVNHLVVADTNTTTTSNSTSLSPFSSLSSSSTSSSPFSSTSSTSLMGGGIGGGLQRLLFPGSTTSTPSAQNQQAQSQVNSSQQQTQSPQGSTPQQQALPNVTGQNSPMPMVQVNSVTPSRMFGAQLFNGNFGNLYGGGFNPDYRVNLGDHVQIQIWGGFTYSGEAVVDSQGNIFLPNVGPVLVAGTPNGQLNALVGSYVRRVYKSNVGVYASLDVSQPVKVFVTGFVRQPGLYAGIASESLLSYLDRAGGVDPDRGSYVDVVVRRGDQIRKKVNLYDFLLNGQLEYVQLQNGDTIVVGPRKHSFSVFGEVYNPYDFESSQSEIPLNQALSFAKPKPGATHVSISRRQGKSIRSEYYPLGQVAGLTVQDGDTLTFTSDRSPGTIAVRVEGAHSGEHAVILPYGSTMKEVLDKLKPNSMSRVDSLQCYRVSMAQRQKEMLNVMLDKLEASAYSARSKTMEEANLRTSEAALISQFVSKARQIEPKGQVILDQSALVNTLLEDGDVIRIPERTSLVLVSGEVVFPNAVSWRKDLEPADYIKQVGGYSQNADSSKVIIIRQNGEALEADDVKELMAGDEIMVLPKIDSKNIEVARAISQIIFQMAVMARVLVSL
jgi:protein involved in polysaccharide export with SLBB domain